MEALLSKKRVIEWLDEVKDPEIPVISLVDLGVIRKIIIEDSKVTVEMTPTFVGCPAMDYMQEDVKNVLAKHGVSEVEVNISFESSWNSNMITDRGREQLRQFGLAPPAKHNLVIDIDVLEQAECPVCGSDKTVMKSPFGPTACRSIHYCESCQETFEQFKPI
jgi:ring-1,2-phenylacetyl-CoA epoxidase subunit PaaD